MTPLEQFKQDYKNKKVLIVGLGLQGRGLGDAKFLAEIGAKVTVTDLKDEAALKPSLVQLAGLPITYVLGEHRGEDFRQAGIVVRNADVPLNSPFLAIAKKAGAQIVMDESLFVQYAPVKVIGVTGTRGKTTTATLIHEILKKTGKRAFLAGNILGKATLPLLKQVRTGDFVVMELSSWQLQGFEDLKFSPPIAVITSIFPDHLNRYSSMKEYEADKKIIFKYQKTGEILILNQSQDVCRELAAEAKNSRVVWFQAADIPKNWQLKIPGEHNRSNLAAALKVAQQLGISKEIVQQVAESFSGVEYRLQLIKEIDGVQFVNDTTSTTPAALEAALKSFKKPIILITGGNSKNLPLDSVAQEVALRTKKVVLLEGTATADFAAKLKTLGVKDKIVGPFDNFAQAIEKAYQLAQPGEIVLLSPGFSSFGMFANEFDRGQQFNDLVTKLKDESQKT